MAPSVDAVGRYFPLAVAAALPSASLDIVGTLMAAQSWFDDIEAIALSAIAPAADAAAIDAAIEIKVVTERADRDVPRARRGRSDRTVGERQAIERRQRGGRAH